MGNSHKTRLTADKNLISRDLLDQMFASANGIQVAIDACREAEKISGKSFFGIVSIQENLKKMMRIINRAEYLKFRNTNSVSPCKSLVRLALSFETLLCEVVRYWAAMIRFIKVNVIDASEMHRLARLSIMGFNVANSVVREKLLKKTSEEFLNSVISLV